MALDIETWNANEREFYVGYMPPVTFAVTQDGENIGVGLAICMKTDKFSKEVGANIAIQRAIQQLAKQEEERWLSRSLTKSEWDKKHGKK